MTLKEWWEQNQDKEVRLTEEGWIGLKDLEPEKPGRWKPEQGDLFFYIIAGGEVHNGRWTRDLNDEMIYAMGNVFKTAKEAEDAAERLKIRAELLDCGGKETHEFHGGSMAIICFVETRGLEVFDGAQPGMMEIGFEREEDAWRAIGKVGEDRIEKYLFGIED